MKQYSIHINGRLRLFDRPWVMGIVNLTPDSFYDGGKITDEKTMLTLVEKMIRDGVDILDVGGQSTRPGSVRISAEEELARVMVPIKRMAEEFPGVAISIDTFYSAVAFEAVNAGAALVNDISAGSIDKNMFATVAALQVPYILMHMKGEPSAMQVNPAYDSIMHEVSFFFSEKINELRKAGVNDIILDPGFGFGKKIEHNYTLLRHLDEFGIFGLPILAGVSRKKMIQTATNSSAEESLWGTIAANTLALSKGAAILRVHDVKAAVDAVKIFTMMSDNT